MKTPVFFLAIVLLSSSVALACRCRSHTAAANAYLSNCVTAISALLVSSTQAVSEITTCQDERLGENGAYADASVVSSNISFLEDGKIFTVTVNVVNDAVIFFDGESVSLVTKPTVTFSQRMRCWLAKLTPFNCDCACSF
jgi:hypothetical protein